MKLNSIITRMHKFHIHLFLMLLALGNLYAQAPEWQWAKSTGGPANDFIFLSAIDPSGSGDIYTTGYFEGTLDFDPGDDTFNLTSNGGFDIFIYKLDASGNLVWARSFGGLEDDYGIAIIPDASGNVYFAGAFVGAVNFDEFQFTSSGLFDMVIAKMDVNSNFIWVKTVGGDAVNFAQHIAVNPAGNGDVYITGRFNGTTDFDPDTSKVVNHTAADWDIFTVKFNGDGHLEWVTTPGSPSFDVGYAVAVDPTGEGDVYSTGSYRGTVDFDPDSTAIFNLTCPGNQCLYLSKLDEDGHFLWAKTITSPNNIYGKALAIDPDNGNIYTTGVFNGTVDFDPGTEVTNLTPNGFDLFISKFDTDGNYVWAKNIGGANFDFCNSIAIDPGVNRDIYLVGFFSGTVDFDPGSGVVNITSEGEDDMFLSKLDNAGNYLWAKAIGGTGRDYGASIIPDLNGQVYVTGQYSSSSISLDSTTLNNTDNAGSTSDFFIAKLDSSIPSASVDVHTTSFSVYPNPAFNQISFELGDNIYGEAQLTIYNNLGTVSSLIPRLDIIRHNSIDVSKLLPGTYIIQLIVNGKSFIAQFVKE